MEPDGVVAALDEAEAGHLRFGLGGKAAPVQQLAFEGRKEALAHGIVAAIADRAHGWAHARLGAAIADAPRQLCLMARQCPALPDAKHSILRAPRA